MASPVSVVIPLAPGETAWKELASSLKLPKGSEVILATGLQHVAIDEVKLPDGTDLKACNQGQGRAGQMNAGAAMAAQNWIWFLHADSRLDSDTLRAVEDVVGSNAEALYFFDLKFLDDGPAAIKWNEWAVRWRAGFLKIPFGDQGFLIRKDLFNALGMYRTDLAYGEDHVFAWKVRQEGYPVLRAGASLFTSARRYETNGWLRTTARFVWLTILQAVPQFLYLLIRMIGRLVR